MTEAPDLATPVTGWRVWVVGSDDGGPALVSPVVSSTWRAREATVATCRMGCARPPGWECRCGLYATARLDHLLPTAGQGAVVGCTALWGRVVEAVSGWRGERGYPLVLFAPIGDDAAIGRGRYALVRAGVRPPPPDLVRGGGAGERGARALSDRYAVPVHPLPAAVPRVADPLLRVLADAVRDEAARGLAARRLGEDDARRRLSRATEELRAALAGRHPPDPPPTVA